MSDSPTVDALVQHPTLRAYAPLLYLAWADGALEPGEAEAVCERACEPLSGDAESALRSWLDPDAPPSSTELMRLLRYVREEASRLDAAARTSLVDLGLSLARRDGGDASDGDATRTALAEVEEALGVKGTDVARELFDVRAPVRMDFDEAEPPFSVARLTELLDGERRETIEQVRALLRDERFRAPVADLDKEAHREQVLAWVTILGEAGVGALSYPESCGGAGRIDRFIAAFETIATFDLGLVVKVGVQFGLFGGALLNLGTERHHERYLPEVGSGAHLGCFAMTELGHGSDVRSLETVARYDADRGVFVVHSPSRTARKEWIGNAAAHARSAVVFAQLETNGEPHGVHALMVPIRDDDGAPMPGVTIEDCGHKMGLNGIDNGRLTFDHVEVPRENLLDRYATVAADGTYESPIASDARRFFTMLGTLVGGRISVGAGAVSAAKTSLAIAVRYSALRRQFGPSGGPERRVLDYPTQLDRLMPMVARSYALSVANADLQRRFTEHDPDADMRELEALAGGLKALSTWHGIDACQVAREACGGMGFLSDNRIASLRRDVDVFATFEGDNVVLLQQVAKSMLSGFAKRFSDDRFGTIARAIGEAAKTALLETNPVAQARTSEEHLSDVGFHREALDFRSRSLLASASRRMVKRVRADMDPFDAFVDIQAHLIAMARAHIEAHVHAVFADFVAGLEPGPERDALESVRALHALHALHSDVGWFLENDYLGGAQARVIRKLVTRRARALRPVAVALVNGFGVPDELLAPIAFEDYAAHLGAPEA